MFPFAQTFPHYHKRHGLYRLVKSPLQSVRLACFHELHGNYFTTIIAPQQTLWKRRVLLFSYVSIWGVWGEDYNSMPLLQSDFSDDELALSSWNLLCLTGKARCVFLWMVGWQWSSPKGTDLVQVTQFRAQKYNDISFWCYSVPAFTYTCAHKEIDHLPPHTTSFWFCPPLQFPPFFCFCPPCKFIFSFFSPPQSSYQNTKHITVSPS